MKEVKTGLRTFLVGTGVHVKNQTRSYAKKTVGPSTLGRRKSK